MELEPVRLNSVELYQILRTRIFESLPDDSHINEVAQAYAKAIRAARQMAITSESPEAAVDWYYTREAKTRLAAVGIDVAFIDLVPGGPAPSAVSTRRKAASFSASPQAQSRCRFA